jgi:hypothetical protein
MTACIHPTEIIQNKNLQIINGCEVPFSLGFVHGKTLKIEIETILQRWKTEVEKNYHVKFETVIQTFFENTTMLDTIKKYCPELLEEVRGIAEGSKQKFELILALQMSEEIEIAGQYLFSGKCTSIGFSQTNGLPTVIAQNMDPPLFLHGFPTLLHIKNNPNSSESYIYTFPGFIGLCGMSKNIAVTCNGMSMLNHRKDGLPVAFILRKLLTFKNENEAFSWIQNIPHATPQCYVIGGITSVKCFECSANSINEFFPFENKNIVLHTNFSAVNNDFNKPYIQLLTKFGKTTSDPYFCPRYFAAFDSIKSYDYKLNTENIKTILSSTNSKVQPISNRYTYGCLIMEMKKNPVLNIAPGKPHKTKFITLQFNKK